MAAFPINLTLAAITRLMKGKPKLRFLEAGGNVYWANGDQWTHSAMAEEIGLTPEEMATARGGVITRDDLAAADNLAQLLADNGVRANFNVNDRILHADVQHQIDLLAIANGLIGDVRDLMKDVEADLVGQIAKLNTDTGYSATRLGKLLRAVQKINAGLYQDIGATLTANLGELADYEAQYQAQQLDKILPFDWPLAQPSAKELQAILETDPFEGRVLADWIAGLETGQQDLIARQLRIGLVNGETMDQLIRRVIGSKALNFKDGILETARRNASAVIRTAVNHVANSAREAFYGANTDLISEVQWVSVLDSRTTPYCMVMDGRTFPIDEGPRPPAHYNCRSVIVPVTKDWESLGLKSSDLTEGTRASANGQVPQSLTYPAWLKQQPRSVVENALGISKAKLFLDGDLEISRFVNDEGKTLTLDQLKQLNAAAWEKAGLD